MPSALGGPENFEFGYDALDAVSEHARESQITKGIKESHLLWGQPVRVHVVQTIMAASTVNVLRI